MIAIKGSLMAPKNYSITRMTSRIVKFSYQLVLVGSIIFSTGCSSTNYMLDTNFDNTPVKSKTTMSRTLA